MGGTLSPKQINYAREQIDKMRPLEKTPIEVVWPFLRYCCCCMMKKRKKPFSLSLKYSLRKKLDFHVSKKADKRFLNDPFESLGYGIHSYLQLVVYLMIMMAFITFIALPLLFLYHNYNVNDHT